MKTNNGFVRLKHLDIPHPEESRRRGWVAERSRNQKIGMVIFFVFSVSVLVLANYLANKNEKQLEEEKNPILWVTGDMMVQKVELSDGTIIRKDDPRVWKYINHKPSYRTEFISH